jgi:AmpD protein
MLDYEGRRNVSQPLIVFSPIVNHRLNDSAFVESPNQSARPDGVEIDLLVIHNISLPPGKFGSSCIAELFCNTLDCSSHPYFEQLRELKVSAHVLIARNGMITQFVPFDRKAWHAGQSCFQGRKNCNEFSIGIELEGTDFEAFDDRQYEALSALTGRLMQAYHGLTVERIVGHSDIAPGRKTDPGPYFNWERFRESLSDYSESADSAK